MYQKIILKYYLYTHFEKQKHNRNPSPHFSVGKTSCCVFAFALKSISVKMLFLWIIAAERIPSWPMVRIPSKDGGQMESFGNACTLSWLLCKILRSQWGTTPLRLWTYKRRIHPSLPWRGAPYQGAEHRLRRPFRNQQLSPWTKSGTPPQAQRWIVYP